MWISRPSREARSSDNDKPHLFRLPWGSDYRQGPIPRGGREWNWDYLASMQVCNDLGYQRLASRCLHPRVDSADRADAASGEVPMPAFCFPLGGARACAQSACENGILRPTDPNEQKGSFEACPRMKSGAAGTPHATGLRTRRGVDVSSIPMVERPQNGPQPLSCQRSTPTRAPKAYALVLDL